MKSVWSLYFLLMAVIMPATACHNQNNSNANYTDPFFDSDPRLKSVTEDIKRSPTDASLYARRGAMLYRLKHDSLALKDYKIASSLDTNKADYYSAVGDLLFEAKDINGSVGWFQKAIAKNPTDKKAHLKIAKLFLYISDYPKAFEQINIVLRHDPHNGEAYYLKGMVHKYMKDTATAISNFMTSLEQTPDYRDPMIELGLLYGAKNNPMAVKFLNNAYAIDSSDVFPIFAEGVYYQNRKEIDSAKERYRKCVLRDRHYADAYFNMGYLLMQEDSLEKSYRQYDLVTKIEPLNPAAYFNRGLCSELMDSVRKAIADYQTASALDTAYKSPKNALKRLKVIK